MLTASLSEGSAGTGTKCQLKLKVVGGRRVERRECKSTDEIRRG